MTPKLEHQIDEMIEVDIDQSIEDRLTQDCYVSQGRIIHTDTCTCGAKFD